MVATRTYDGSCHCGAVRWRLRSEPITSGRRCNCSLCIRRGAVMSPRYYPPDDFEELTGLETLRVYLWGDRLVNHYFCTTCGVYPFHDATRAPRHFRVNLGCLGGVDPLALPVELIDGRAF